MPPEAPSPPASFILDPRAWLAEHPTALMWAGAFCLWASASLIARMWIVHRNASALKKLVWSVVLLIPILGWILYAGCFSPPDIDGAPLLSDSGAGNTGGIHYDAGGGHP